MTFNSSIQSANLHFNALGTPIADDFDDVYFSNDDGLAESQYVFIAGNQLPKRWRAHNCYSFSIAETGFGTGLNFLACWQAFEDFLAEPSGKEPSATGLKRLHFISFEKFPITQADLCAAHAQFPNLSHYAKQLQQQYPQQFSPGCHRLSFANGSVLLDLWLGDVNELMPQLHSPTQGVVDAWFLDGFAPSKNPQMWQQNLFDQMFRLSRSNATVATFTAAGFIRRGLAQAGFEVQKQPGYGSKRDMTIGRKLNEKHHQQTALTSTTEDVIIIGGGIGACLAAWQLAQAGKKITLLCADAELAQAASGNKQGALYPLLTAQPSTLSDFYQQAFACALRDYQQLIEQAPEIRHQWCGLLHLNSNAELTEKHTAIAANQYPEALVKMVNATLASELAGIQLPHDALYYPDGAWLCPGDICRFIGDWLLENGHQLHFNCSVKSIQRHDQKWQVEGKQSFQADQVVIAAGIHSNQFDVSQHLPISAVRGQVSHVPATNLSKQLKTVLCHTGYLTPANLDADPSHCLGATFSRQEQQSDLLAQDHQTNLQRLEQAMPSSELNQQWGDSPTAGRVGFRAVLRDHFPVVGPIPDWQSLSELPQSTRLDALPCQSGLFVLSGLGARGICSAPLAASILTAYVCGTAQPTTQSILDAVHPGRFVWRRIKKNRPLLDE